MLDLIRSLFNDSSGNESESSSQDRDLEAAAAALMIEAAGLDGRFEDAEHDAIHAILVRRFGLDDSAAETLIEEGRRTAEDSVQIYDVIRVIRDELEPDERVDVIEMLWEVAYADGEVHDYEANLVRRITGLLYVSDQDSGAARKRVVERLMPQGETGF